VKQVLNINGGTVLAGCLHHKLGVDMEFKISVFMGNDNPFNVLRTLETAADIGKCFGFEDAVRLEHHITETYKSIVRQPYDRLDELLDAAKKVRNISAKHDAVQRTAASLVKNGIPVFAAPSLHHR
jgi:hypothetical protein